MDNLKEKKVSHFEAFKAFINILDGEIVSGGCYENREECNHDIMQREQPNWDAVKDALNDFLYFDSMDKFVEIAQTLKKNSQGFAIMREVCKERQSTLKIEIHKKECELEKLNASLETFNELLI